MGEKVVGRIESFAASGFDSMAEMQGVPVDDDGGEQVEARDPIMLARRPNLAALLQRHRRAAGFPCCQLFIPTQRHGFGNLAVELNTGKK